MVGPYDPRVRQPSLKPMVLGMGPGCAHLIGMGQTTSLAQGGVVLTTYDFYHWKSCNLSPQPRPQLRHTSFDSPWYVDYDGIYSCWWTRTFWEEIRSNMILTNGKPTQVSSLSHHSSSPAHRRHRVQFSFFLVLMRSIEWHQNQVWIITTHEVVCGWSDVVDVGTYGRPQPNTP